MPRATVLLADDHAVVAEGLASLLGREFALVGVVADGVAMLEAARRLRPDAIVADVAMPGMSGLEALRRLRAEAVPARVIFLTMHADPQIAAEAFRAGASGFVAKHAAGRELIAAIRAVLRGGTYLTPHLSQDVITALAERGTPEGGKLTPRQGEVVRLIAAGRTMKEVAAVLGVSPRTVETHKYEVMQALGLATTADLIRYAIEHGLTAPPGQGGSGRSSSSAGGPPGR
jgi:DNA-binding NarL/FixJ family response regulator